MFSRRTPPPKQLIKKFERAIVFLCNYDVDKIKYLEGLITFCIKNKSTSFHKRLTFVRKLVANSMNKVELYWLKCFHITFMYTI